jgi:hypothetical protein
MQTGVAEASLTRSASEKTGAPAVELLKALHLIIICDMLLQ